jgi:hypothetical protein
MKPIPSSKEADILEPRLRGRRRKEPIGFWLQLLGGSLVVHGVLLTIALPITARLSTGTRTDAPTPIEVVELAPESDAPSVESAASLTETPAEPAVPPLAEPAAPSLAANPEPDAIGFAPEPDPLSPSPAPSPEVIPSPSIEPSPIPPLPETPTDTAALPSNLPAPSPEVSPAPSPEVSPAPSPAPSQNPFPESSPESSPAPSPESSQNPFPEPSPEPFPESSPEPSPVLSDESASGDAVNENGDRVPNSSPADPGELAASPLPEPSPSPTPDEPGLQTTPIDTPVPDVSQTIAAAPSNAETGNLDPTAANPAAAPTGVLVSLAAYSEAPLAATGGDNTPEIQDTLEIARPTTNSMAFIPDPATSACQVTPSILNQIGTPIELIVTTDERGGVLNVSVYKSSGNSEYDQLAACLVQTQWQFSPATVLDSTGTQRQPIASDALLLNLTLDRN